jgi:hypothetical protein
MRTNVKIVLSAFTAIAAAAAIWLIIGVAEHNVASNTDISGFYTGVKGRNQAVFVKITEAQNGQLSGFFEEAALYPNGAVGINALPLSGSQSNGYFTLSLVPSQFAFMPNSRGGTIFSGTFTGKKISLYWDETPPLMDPLGNDLPFVNWDAQQHNSLDISRGTIATYQDDVATLDAKSDTLLQSKLAQAAAAQAAVATRLAKSPPDMTAPSQPAFIHKLTLMVDNLPYFIPARVQELGNTSQQIQNYTDLMQSLAAKTQTTKTLPLQQEQQISGLLAVNGHEQDEIFDAARRLVIAQTNGMFAFLQLAQNHAAACQNFLNSAATFPPLASAETAEMTDCATLVAAMPELLAAQTQLSSAYQTLFNTWETDGPIQRSIISSVVIAELPGATTFSIVPQPAAADLSGAYAMPGQ